jgi:hypothetical protein
VGGLHGGGWELLGLVQAALPEINHLRRGAVREIKPKGKPFSALPKAGHTNLSNTMPLPFTDEPRPDYVPITDPALIEFGKRQGGDGGGGVEPLVVTTRFSKVPTAVALALVKRLQPSTTEGMLIPPMAVVEPPFAESDLNWGSYDFVTWPIDKMVSVVPELDRRRLTALIDGSEKFDLPFVAISGGVAHVYRGLERIVALSLLGENESTVGVISALSIA